MTVSVATTNVLRRGPVSVGRVGWAAWKNNQRPDVNSIPIFMVSLSGRGWAPIHFTSCSATVATRYSLMLIIYQMPPIGEDVAVPEAPGCGGCPAGYPPPPIITQSLQRRRLRLGPWGVRLAGFGADGGEGIFTRVPFLALHHFFSLQFLEHEPDGAFPGLAYFGYRGESAEDGVFDDFFDDLSGACFGVDFGSRVKCRSPAGSRASWNLV
jgi:hypothetical protein